MAEISRIMCSGESFPAHGSPSWTLWLHHAGGQRHLASLGCVACSMAAMLLLARASPVSEFSTQAHPSHHSMGLMAAGRTQPAKCLGKSSWCCHMLSCLAKRTVPMGTTCKHFDVDGLCAARWALGIQPLGDVLRLISACGYRRRGSQLIIASAALS